MTITDQQASCPPPDNWAYPVDWGLVVGRFGKIKNINPHFPKFSLEELLPIEKRQGRREPWDDIESRYQSYALQEMDYEGVNPYQSISLEVRLILGVLSLPRQLVRGAYKRLFGEISEIPTAWEVSAVGFALFNPQCAFGRQCWPDLCRKADLNQARRNAITAQVQELLELGR